MTLRTLSLACAAVAFSGVLAACAKAEDAPSGEAAPAGASAPAAAGQQAAASSRRGPPPLSAYIGKPPFEEVQGVSFFKHPLVRAAIEASGIDRDLQKAIVYDDTVVGVVTPTRGRLLVSGYDPVGAGSTNWAILLVADGSKAAVCYSTGVVPDQQGADWYYEGDKVFTLYQPCPSEEGDMESLSNWPIGPIPG